jgi:hypothetical protein
MLDSELEKAIKEAFNLSTMRGGAESFHEKDGEQVPVMARLIWIVEILEDYLAGATVVGVKTKHMDGSLAWYRGLLLVPPVWEPQDRNFAGKNLKPAEMEWPNAIIPALESMNIAPYEKPPIRYGTTHPECQVHTYTQSGNANIHLFKNPVQKQRVFWDALWETVESLIEAMDDPEILEFFERAEIDY